MAYTLNDATLTTVTGDFAGNDYFGLDGTTNGPRKVLCSRFVLNDKSYADPAWITSLAASKVGLGSVENKSSATIRGEITSGNVTTALGFTPYNSTNPSGYITSSALSSYLTTATAASTYQTVLVSGTSIKTINGTSVLGSGDITISASSVTNAAVITALGFTPYNSTNPNGYISSITSANVTTALGYTPYNSSNPSGYITSSALSSYLPLSGGTLSGVLTSNVGGYGRVNGNDQYHAIVLRGSVSGTTSQTVTAGDYMEFIEYGGAWNFRQINATGTNSVWATINTSGITWNGNQVLHAGNYTSYSPSLTGSGASGTWGISVSGTAATATTANALSGLTLNSSAAAAVPDNVTQNQIGYNSSVSLFGQTDGGLHSSAYNSSWIHQIYGDFRTGQMAIRGKNNGTWQTWRVVLDASNYTSYSPSLTGSGASGTWGINITGNAATVSNGVYTNSSASISGDNYFTFGPNSSWGKSIRIGGNGRTLTTGSSVVTTNGNLHLDSADGNNLYLNYYAGGLIYLLGGSHYIYNGGANYTGNAASASSVAWGNVSSKPGSIFYYAGWATDANTVASNSSSFCYSVNAAATGPLAYFEASGYGLQLSCGYGDGSNFYWRVRNGDNGTWQSWRRVLTEDVWINNKHFGSDGNIYSNASMRAPIFYDQNDTYYSVDPNGTSRLANRLYLHDWIEFVNYSGLYSGNNGAHFYPNNASYGSWRVAGSRNGWAGLEFDASNGQQSMMVSTGGNTIGWHNNSYGWKFFWESGRMYCFDSTYGGGPQRMLLMQDTWQGSKYFGSDGTVYHCFQYDANDTGYYLDANGTSRMNSVVANNLYAYGTVTAYYSDDRLKTRFSNIADALDKVCSLNGFFYVGNSVAESLGYKKKMEVGLSAQEVQRILPEVVVPAPIDENYLTIQYDRVVPLLVEAIKELRLELNQLKSLVKL